MKHTLATIEHALATLKTGKMIILIDNEDTQNGGHLVVAADYATPESIDFMSKKSCSLISLSLSGELVDKLQLPMMPPHNKSPDGPDFTVSIDAAHNVSTGISSKDKAQTIKVAIDPKSTHTDLISPGHIFPLRAKDMGVLKRAGITEGSVDLARLAGLTPAAVFCDMTHEDGTMSTLKDLHAFSQQHDMPIVTIKDLIAYRMKHESLVYVEASTRIPLHNKGDFNMTLFANDLDNAEHLALVKPQSNTQQLPLVRIHSECLTGDVFGSCKCDCGHQLEQSLALIAEEGGVLIYLRQEGRGIGLANKLKAYALQDKGFDTVDANHELGLPADSRSYVIAYQILKHLGMDSVRLLTNNPEKIEALHSFGIKVEQRLPLEIEATKESHQYLKTKKERMGHLLDSPLLVKARKK